MNRMTTQPVVLTSLGCLSVLSENESSRPVKVSLIGVPYMRPILTYADESGANDCVGNGSPRLDDNPFHEFLRHENDVLARSRARKTPLCPAFSDLRARGARASIT